MENVPKASAQYSLEQNVLRNWKNSPGNVEKSRSEWKTVNKYHEPQSGDVDHFTVGVTDF